MPRIQRLNDQERLFLTFTPPGVRWYAIGAGFCEPADEAHRPSVATLVDTLRSRMHLASPRFRQRILHAPFGLAAPAWVDDERFDVAAHVVEALSPGATVVAFERLVADLAMAPMDVDRPLWDVHLVPSLADGRSGFVIRAHHSMVDGTQLLAFLVRVLFDDGPERPAPAMPPPWTPQPPPGQRELVLDGLDQMRRRIGSTVRRGMRRAANASGWRATAASFSTTLRAAAAEFAPPQPSDLLRRRSAAADLLGRPAIGGRAISRHAADLATMKAVARAHDATLNDLAAAIVADAMRRLLRAHDLPLRPLRVLTPVNLDAGRDEEHVGFMLLPLPLADEPQECLRKIAAHSRRERDLHRAALVDELLGQVGHASRHAYRVTQQLVQSPRSAALALSNVRGPDQPLWLDGAQITELFPVLPLGPHHDLAVGLLSYRGRVALCAIRDPTVAPELDAFGGCLDAALAAAVGDDRPLRDR